MISDHGDRAIFFTIGHSTHSEISAEIWTYEASTFALRRRRPLPMAMAYGGNISPSGLRVEQHQSNGVTPVVRIYANGRWQDLVRSDRAGKQWPDISDAWVAVQEIGPEGIIVLVFDTQTFAERLELRLDGTDRSHEDSVGVRFQGDQLVVFDTRGRVLVVAMESGDLIRDFRLSTV